MYRQVILYSGGMDSHILAHLHPHALRLYVDVGSRYSVKEMRHLPQGVVINHDMNLGAWEREDAIIPCRNEFLVMVAAQYGDTIMLGATAGDQSRDKDERWAMMSTNLLQYMLSGAHFTDPERHPQVVLPIKRFTKAELVAEYLRTGGDSEALARTVSCYHPDFTHCGHCKSCLRKWIALEYNDVPSMDEAEYAINPGTPEHWAEIIHKINNGGWRTPAEDYQTSVVLRRHRIMQ